jgi:L-asparaginase II
MSNPVVAEVLRGDRIESVHRGAGAVVDASGGLVMAFGDVDRPVYPRSAVKALQALPLIESGAADRLGLTETEIALACASHAGEEEHLATARAMLAKVGRGADALECGAHWPLGEAAARALARSGGKPNALHNNCSGKHAGFVCFACVQGLDPKGYIAPDHLVQREVTAAVAAVTAVKLAEELRGIDGCSIPTYAIPLTALAHGFARFATGQGLQPFRARAAARIRACVAAHPAFVAGAGRFDTEVMTILGARAFTKTGAEGAYCAALPELGLGLAVKTDDGGARAAQVMIARLLQRFGGFDETLQAQLEPFTQQRLVNWNGVEVGVVRPAGPLADPSIAPHPS